MKLRTESERDMKPEENLWLLCEGLQSLCGWRDRERRDALYGRCGQRDEDGFFPLHDFWRSSTFPAHLRLGIRPEVVRIVGYSRLISIGWGEGNFTRTATVRELGGLYLLNEYNNGGVGPSWTDLTVYYANRLVSPLWDSTGHGIRGTERFKWGQLIYQIWSQSNTSNPFIHGPQV